MDNKIINDDYWLNLAANNIESNISTRDTAANNIDKFLGLLWTTYTAIFTGATFTGYIDGSNCYILLIAQPILVIFIARLLALLMGASFSI